MMEKEAVFWFACMEKASLVVSTEISVQKLFAIKKQIILAVFNSPMVRRRKKQEAIKAPANSDSYLE